MKVVPYTLLDDINREIVNLHKQNRSPKEIVLTKDELEILRKELGRDIPQSGSGYEALLFGLPLRVEQ